MLVLSRKVMQSIKIGGNIEITVLSVNGRRVRLGIEAPQDVPVHRSEIERRIQLIQPEKQFEDRDPTPQGPLNAYRHQAKTVRPAEL